MTVSKITTPISELDEVDKINEIIDEKQDVLTAGTNITIENNVISSTAQESFFRGKFSNFTNVPTSASGYEPEPGTQDQTTPTQNDFIVVLDASDYASSDFTEQFTFSWSARNGKVTWTYNAETITVGDGTYPVTFGPDNCMYIISGGGLKVNKTSKFGATILYTNSSPQWLGGSTLYSCATTGSAGLYQGSWRFYYDGTWSVEGKTGWLPQYQIENTLPIADEQTLGIAKLYTTTGQNEDGSMTQKAITDSLPTVYDSTISFTQGGVSKGSFTLNQSTGATIELDAGGGGSSYSADCPALTAVGGVCTWTITHTLASKDITIRVYEVSTGSTVVVNSSTTATDTVVISILSASDIAAGTYRIVLTK